MILNIESSTGICSVCISQGAEMISFQQAENEYEHSRILTTLIDDCLKDQGLSLKDIDAVAVSSGPGSYTSLRVGISTAKGICYALEKPLLSIDTLQSLALSAKNELDIDDALYCSMIDARRMEVYCRIFDQENNPINSAAAIVIEENSFDDLIDKGKKIIFCGNGAEKCRSILSSDFSIFHPSQCSASSLPAISNKLYGEKRFQDVAYCTPFYLKPPNITVPKNMKL